MTDREKIDSNNYIEVLSDYLLPEGIEYPLRDYVVQLIDGDIGITYINRNEVDPVSIRNFTYRSVPKVYGLLPLEAGTGSGYDPTPLIQSGISQIQREPLNLKGSGVVIGIISTGIDYEDEVFRKPDGSSRILGIWDQTGKTGEPPAGLLYGTEYRKETIDEALLSENPREIVPSVDEMGNGTAMASVAAGSAIGSGLRFSGAAPEADIAVVKLRQAKPFLREYFLVPDEAPAYAESDLLTALRYLEGYAVSLVRPLVICMGVGTNMGNHNGQSILSAYLNRIATRRSRAVVISGGDEGNSAPHYVGYRVEGLAETTDNAEIRVDVGERGFIAELWGSIPATHAISIKSPGGETTDRVNFLGRQTREFSFIYERTKVRVDHILVEQNSGEELIFFRFVDPTPGVWTIQVTIMDGSSALDGSFHIWLPIGAFLTGSTYFLRPSPYTTLTEPANAAEIITTTAFNDKNISFYAESGRGFTRGGQIKPDICSPGVEISTSIGKQTGTAMGAALLSGACAQFMQWAVVEGNRPWVESRELKNFLIRGAVRNAGDIYPGREWGYGRLNMAGTFEQLAGI